MLLGSSVKVTVVFLGRASEIAGVNIVDVELVDGAKLKDLIEVLGERVSRVISDRYFKGHYIFVLYVNGVPTDDPNRELKNGDRVVFITPEMGG